MPTEFIVIGLILFAGIPIAVLTLLKKEYEPRCNHLKFRFFNISEPQNEFADEPTLRKRRKILTVLGIIIILVTLIAFMWGAFILIQEEIPLINLIFEKKKA